jgi:hypothetical protein
MGLQLRKTPARSSLRWFGAGYMVINTERNEAVAGACQREYEMTLEQVEAFADREETERARPDHHEQQYKRARENGKARYEARQTELQNRENLRRLT